jgi:hypothetical protein
MEVVEGLRNGGAGMKLCGPREREVSGQNGCGGARERGTFERRKGEGPSRPLARRFEWEMRLEGNNAAVKVLLPIKSFSVPGPSAAKRTSGGSGG